MIQTHRKPFFYNPWHVEGKPPNFSKTQHPMASAIATLMVMARPILVSLSEILSEARLKSLKDGPFGNFRTNHVFLQDFCTKGLDKKISWKKWICIISGANPATLPISPKALFVRLATAHGWKTRGGTQVLEIFPIGPTASTTIHSINQWFIRWVMVVN